MNRMFDFKMMIKAMLIVTLSLAIVFASGCRRKQPDASSAPVADNQKSPEHDTSSEKPAVEARDQNVQIVEANAPNTVESVSQVQNVAAVVSQDQNMAATVHREPNVTQVAAQTEPAAATMIPEEPNTTGQIEEIILSGPPDMKTFESFKDSANKIKYMAAVAKAYPGSLTDFVDKAIDDADPGVRGAAVGMLANKGFYSPDVVPVALKAMNDNDPAIRQQALEACANVTDPAITDVLAAALDDTSEEIRIAAIQMTARKPLAVSFPILEAGITSQYPDVKAGAATELMHVASPAALDVLITALNDPDPDFHYTIKSMINSLVGQEFDTSAQAQKWWNENSSNFGNDLKPIDPNLK
jgi:HEAT repeats